MKQSTEFIWEQVDMVIKECKNHDIAIPRFADISLTTFISELVSWNDKMNLVSKNDMQNVGQRHVLDSLSPLLFFSLKKEAKVLDIGSGAGFPAAILKIFRMDLDVTLVESRKKKVGFLQAIVPLLDFKDFEPIWERIELLEAKANFDYAISRATASPEKLARWTFPHIKPGGKLILFLGPSDVARLDYLKKDFKYVGFSGLLTKESPFSEKKFHVLMANKPK